MLFTGRVRHFLLFLVITKIGFADSFINWIKACLSGPWIAPLINGGPTSFFQSKRGLRQGCPLSPLLYIIMADSLSHSLERKRAEGSLTGIYIVRGVKEVNHSQFADDTLLMGGASTRITSRFKGVMEKLLDASGGKINKRKSRIYGWNVGSHQLHNIAWILEFPFEQGWTSFTYLGIFRVIGLIPKADLWQTRIPKKKIHSKTRQWGTQWLNPAGIIIFIKTVLSSISIYKSSIMLAPSGVTQSIGRAAISKFIWQRR